MEKVTLENINRYLSLNNELSKKDPYILITDKQSFLNKHKEKIIKEKEIIYILKENAADIGFIFIVIESQVVFIEKIYIKETYKIYSKYIKMLYYIYKLLYKRNINQIKYIGVNENNELNKALKEFGFNMIKEHIQMEKKLQISPSTHYLPDIKIKAFHTIKNHQWIYQFMKECLNEEIFNYTLNEVKDIVEQEKDFAYIVYKETKPIGFIVAYINEKRNEQEEKKVIYIEQIAVHNNYRNKGVATKLINYICGLGKSKGMNIARLHVYSTNLAAYKLYEKLGFLRIKSIGHWVLDYTDYSKII